MFYFSRKDLLLLTILSSLTYSAITMAFTRRAMTFWDLPSQDFPIVSAVWGHCEVSLCHDMHLTLPRRLTCSIFLWPASKTVVPDFFPSGYSGLYHQPPIWQGFSALLRLLRKFQYQNLLWSDSDIRTHLTISNHFIIIPLAFFPLVI